jgi:hypothetical protein
MRDLSQLGGLTLRKLVADGAHDRGIADGSVVERDVVDHGHGIEQPAVLDLLDDLEVLGAYVRLVDVEVRHLDVVTVAASELVADDGRDLLRRPRRASTAGETDGRGGDIEYVDANR